MNAIVVTVGAEILAGDILDSNFRDIARRLNDLGIPVVEHRSVPDDEARIAAAVKDAMAAADVVIATGGLGPTPDDVTREGVALALGVSRVHREDLLPALTAIFRRFGVDRMPDANLLQLQLPEGSTAIANPVGTAPGFHAASGASTIFVLPGVPAEMRAMMEETVLPWIRQRFELPHRETRLLRTMGIGESHMVEKLAPVMDGWRGVGVAFYPQQPGVDLKLTHHGKDVRRIVAELDRAEASAREILGSSIYGMAGDTLAGAVGRLLVERGWRLAVAESCTGGALGAEFTAVPGASAWFDRGAVTYSDRAKSELVGVPESLIAKHGAVSEEVARAMAGGMRHRAGVDLAVATTGIAGPTGGTDDKPVGLVFTAVAAPDGTRCWRTTSPGTRSMIVRRTVVNAVNRVRLVLLGEA